tara:strand:- start:5718 stop:7370 length:1653 start_codon:yes stop_codon:yes gene_type:complete
LEKLKKYSISNLSINSIIIFTILISIFSTIIFFQFTTDDAYITFRHSFNLVKNGILSWNIDGPKEEVFTNPLYVLLGTFGIKLGIKPELPIKIFSLGLFYFWLYRALKICNPSTKVKKICVASLFLLCIQSYMHIFSGLETLFYSFLLFEYLICEEFGSLKDISIGCILILCRPEGAIFLLISIVRFIIRLINRNLTKSNLNNIANVISLLIIIFTIFIFSYKFLYFGDFFPNSFYAKTLKPYGTKGLGFIFELNNLFKNFLNSAPWLFLFIICFNWERIKGWDIFKFSGFGIIYFVYLRSWLAMNFGDRFWYQLFWPLIIYSIISNEKFLSIFSILKLPKNKFKNFSGMRSFLLSIAGIYWMISQFFIGPKAFLHKVTYMGRVIRAHATIGKLLNNYLPPTASIYTLDAGLIPYYAKRRTYDRTLGTKELVLNGVNNQFFEKKKPDIFVLYSAGCSDQMTYKELQKVELDFIEKNQYIYLGGFYAAKNSCYNIYSNNKVSKFLDNTEFLDAKNRALVNTRKEREGILQDILLSYRYLFSAGSDIPSDFE